MLCEVAVIKQEKTATFVLHDNSQLLINNNI